MTELNPDVPDKPVEVAYSPASAQAAAGSRDVLLVVAALPALVGVLGTHDVNKIVGYIGSTDFAPVLGILLTAGTVVYRQWLTRHNHANSVKMATALPNDKAVVK